ncbi:MAG: N-acetylmuramoyl-L-alanine amidase [Roseburia sp.]|nr:N-acetylmuramoyl-L-alanine amidase [Roseburia sp.]
MKRIAKWVILIMCILFLLSGCNEQSDGIWPMAIMVDGQVYLCYDEIIESDDVEILGYITSTVEISQGPKEDNQANFPCLNQPYGTLNGRMMIFYEDNWHKCYLSSEIEEGNGPKKEPYLIKFESIETSRVSRQEIGISWLASYDDVADSYIIKRRDVENGQGVGEWNTIATIESDKTLSNGNWQYIDALESDEPQQYEYRIDMEISDTESYVTEEGKTVFGSNIKVCIDPGHYNIAKEVADADEYRYVEGNFVLEIALELRDILKEEYGIDSCLTRETDTITLGGYTDDELDSAHISLRGEYAAEEDCDLFVSLHTNSNAEDANGYPTFFQLIEINKPIIIVNQTALTSDVAMNAANTIGLNLAEANYELGLSVSDLFHITLAEDISEWTQELNDGFELGTVVCRTGKKGDYYGILRGATSVGVPGMIIEHGHHSVQEVRRAAVEGELAKAWAKADAAGIAFGFGF